MFSFVKTVKRPICKAFIEFTFRHIPLIFSVYLLIIEINDGELVFDNIHHQGITRLNWIQNLYSPILDAGLEFQIRETYF